jgi:glycosyltransferase involved in cell wall biosynthesis
MRLYGTQEEKIAVIGEGYQKDTISNFKFQISNSQPYVLFIGRIEERKNVVRIIEAFEILKERYQLPHQLVLVGKSGFGYRAINYKLEATSWKEDIIEKGYVTEEEKFELLRNADVFVFPSLYEGFGLPVLEAQAVGVPVVTSNTSSLPEVGGEGAIYADPLSSESIAKGIYTVLQMSEEEKGQLQKKGFENLERFSWEQCAQSVSRQF